MALGYLGATPFPGRGRAEPASQPDDNAVDGELTQDEAIDNVDSDCAGLDLAQDDGIADDDSALEQSLEVQDLGDEDHIPDIITSVDDALAEAGLAEDNDDEHVAGEAATFDPAATALVEGDTAETVPGEPDPVDEQLQRLQDMLETAELRDAGVTDRVDQNDDIIDDGDHLADIEPPEPPPGFGPLDEVPPLVDDVVCGAVGSPSVLPSNQDVEPPDVLVESCEDVGADAFVMSPTPSPTADVAVEANTVEEELRMEYLALIKRAADQRKVLWETCAEIRDLEMRLGLDDDLTDRTGIDLRKIKSFQMAMTRAGFGTKHSAQDEGLPSDLLRPEKRHREEIQAAANHEGSRHPLGAMCKMAPRPPQTLAAAVVQPPAVNGADEDIEI